MGHREWPGCYKPAKKQNKCVNLVLGVTSSRVLHIKNGLSKLEISLAFQSYVKK